MKKSDIVDLKKKADIAIKEGIKNGKIKKVEPQKITSFIDDSMPIIIESKEQQKEDETVKNSSFSWINSSSIYSYTKSPTDGNTITYWSDQPFQRFLIPDQFQPSFEPKINQAYEDIASLRKYAGELEKKIVTQNQSIVDLIQDKNKLKKQMSDLREEVNEFMKKYAEPTLFIKNEMNRIRRERQKMAEFKETFDSS